MYAVQNDTGIKFNIQLYIKVIFVGQGVGIQKAYPGRWNKTYMTWQASEQGGQGDRSATFRTGG